MIIFKTLKWKNFLSYGNYWTEIEFTKSPTTLIHGSNGSGKSSFLDALTFALFGKPYRFINKPRLVNSINDKDCMVELTFDIGKKSYLIKRGLKPVVFEIYCDGILINQDSKNLDYQKQLEDSILKLNFDTFSQIVVLGTAIYVPFMQLTAAQRREVIEELLDLNIFSRMNDTLKEKQSALKEEIKSIDNKIEVTKEKIAIHKTLIAKLKSKTQEEKTQKLQEIQDNLGTITQISNELDKATSQLKLLTEESEKLKKSNKLTEFVDIESRLVKQSNTISKTIEFYETSDACPTCKQQIDATFKTATISEKQKAQKEIEDALTDIKTRIEKSKKLLDAYNDCMTKIKEINFHIMENNTRIRSLQESNIKIQKSLTNVSDSEIIEEEAKVSQFDADISQLISNKQETVNLKHNYDIIQALLKDTGIKSKIIKQYLPLMNKLINKYLSTMDFFVNFNLDESFKETIKSRHRDDYEYNSFSEGEKFRIDMSLLLTWREIAKTRNSTNTNILILDEVFDSSLDAGGTEEFMKLLKQLSQDINIFVISHKPDLMSNQFDSSIKIEKKNNFSKMV